MIKKIALSYILFLLALTNILSQCVGESGQVSWQYWGDILYYEIEHFYVDDTYPMGPDKTRVLNSISSPPNYDDEYGSLVKGFISVPESGEVRFNVTGDDITYFLLSTDATKENLDTIAYTTQWTSPTEYNKVPEQTSDDYFLNTGNLYYFELHLREGGGGDHSSVHWQRPYVNNTSWQVITSPFLTDVCDNVCPPKGTACDDGDSNTSEDIEDGNCNCIGIINSGGNPLGLRSELQVYFYDDIVGGDLNTLLQDPKFPAMPDRMEVIKDGLSVKWSDTNNDYGAFIQGYLVAPTSGLYDFNVTGVADVRFYLSSDAQEANKTANMIETQWGTGPLDHDVPQWNGSQTMTNINLIAGQTYYFEVFQNVGHWGHRFDIFWNAPWHLDQSWHKIPEVHYYDYTDELACLPLDTPCDDGDPFTKNDMINESCDCIGVPCVTDCDDPEGQFMSYDYCETTYELGNRVDDSWVSCNPSPNPYLESRDGFHWIHYDLGDEYLLSGTHVWNYNVSGETTKGFESVAVDYSLNGQDWFNLGTFNWNLASGQTMYSGFIGPNFNSTAVRYVMFTSLDAPSSCRGISKINFTVDQCQQQGLACDDNDPTTYNDNFNNECQCQGYTLAQMDCGADTLYLSETDISPNTYHAVKSLISNGEVINSNNTNYRAGVEIILSAGFEVENGSIFEAQIEDCPPPSIAFIETADLGKDLKKKIQPELSLNVYDLEGRSEQTIKFFLPEPSQVTLDIMDLKGNVIRQFISHNYENYGNYYKRLQTKKISAGVYMIRLSTDKEVKTEKMVVL